MIPDDTSFITDEASLRALHHQPMSRATDKVLRVLDKHCLRIISLAPFCVVATQSPNGADVSPRGDPAGFVRVLDERTLILPDRIGNNRLDGMTNLLVNPRIGLLFLVPGMNETLRINGTARLSHDPALLSAAAVNGREPRLVIVVSVKEAFLHCGKALKRSKLWHDDYRVDKKDFPSLGRMIVEQTKPANVTVEQADEVVEEGYRNKLY